MKMMSRSPLMLFFCSFFTFHPSIHALNLPNLCTTGTGALNVPAGAFNCSIPSNVTLTLQAGINNTISAVMIQSHTLQEDVNIVDSRTGESATGSHTGMLRYVDLQDSYSVSWSVRTVSTNQTVNVLFLVTLYSVNDPLPGACNQEFTPENEPNLHFNSSPTSDLGTMEFADGNLGSIRDLPPPVCDKALQLEYHMYIYYMPTKDYAAETMMEAVRRMMTPEGVQKHGQKVTSRREFDLKRTYLALFKNRGTIYNVLVHDPKLNTSSAYVPYVNYACDQKLNGTVCTYTDMGPTMVYTFCGLLGTILCFLGHWTFLYEIFMFGFLPTVVGIYMLLAANTGLMLYGIMATSIGLGIIGGMGLTSLWWRFGRVTPTVVWISIVLGFQLASVLFFTPFGYLSIWQDNTVFGLAFACAMLVPPIFGLIFHKWMSLIACAVIGSYMMTSTLSFFFGGILHYVIQNVVHRATQENFGNAIVILPGNPVDFILASLWCGFAILGVATQAAITRKDSTDFPECPYKSFRERRRMLRWGTRDGNPTALISGRINPSDSDHTPLVGDL